MFGKSKIYGKNYLSNKPNKTILLPVKQLKWMALNWIHTYLDSVQADGISPVSDVACQDFIQRYPCQQNVQITGQPITSHRQAFDKQNSIIQR